MNFLEFDDSLFQVGLTDRTRQFITFTPGYKLTTNKSIYISEGTGNVPAFMIYLGYDKIANQYERKVYDLLNFFGLVGGFIEVFHLTFSFLVYFFCNNLIEAKTVNIFFNSTFGQGYDGKHK